MRPSRNLVSMFVLGLSVLCAGASRAGEPLDVDKPAPGAQRVTMELDEGTWMSVDVSPDGSTLVFDLLGDLYSLPIAGGKAKALTKGPAWDMHPRYSPDGKTIAFTSDRDGMENVWLVDADGTSPRPVTSEKDSYVRSAVFTPDGQYLVARKQDGKRGGIPPVELWMWHREGGAGIRITSSEEIDTASGPALTRDGRYLYFSVREKKFSYSPDLSNGLWKIVRYDRRTAETTPFAWGIGGAVRPCVSPDGKSVAYVSRRDERSVLVLRDVESGGERILAGDVSRDEQEGFGALDQWPNYAFLPDGKALVFGSRGKLRRLELATLETKEIPFLAVSEQAFGPRVMSYSRLPTGPVEPRILRWPSQSPDGSWIAFEALGRIWLQRLASGKPAGDPRRLTTDGPALPPREYAPSFAPDGRWIAFVSWSDREGGHVWKAEVPAADAKARKTSVGPVKLTRSPGHFLNPTFSPKGDRLVVLRGSGLELRGRQPEDDESMEIRTLSSSGGDTELVTTVAVSGDNLRFHPQAFFSRDGARLYFREGVEKKKPTDPTKNDLVSVRLDGTDKKRHLRFPTVTDVVPSPDEAWVLFTSRDNAYLTALPGTLTKEPPEVDFKEAAVPSIRLTGEAGTYVAWADGGKTVTWALASTFHRLPLEAALRFLGEERQRALDEEKKADKKADEGALEKKKDEEALRLPPSESLAIRLSVPRDVPTGALLLQEVRIVSMREDEVLEGADILVVGNRIEAIGPTGTLTVPPGARKVPLRGKTVIPGLIDTHGHLHYSAFELFPETKWEYAANLAYGVTSVYDPSAHSLDVFAQAEMIEAGTMLGPRIFSSGDVLYGGQQQDIYSEVKGEEDALRQVRRMKAYGARMIKVYQQPRRDQRLWFAKACRTEGMLLTAEGAGELHTDLTMGLDGYTAFEHGFPVELHRDVVGLAALTGTVYTPTLLVSYGGPVGELYFWQTRNPHDDPKLRRFVPEPLLDRLGRRHPWIWPSEYVFPAVARGAAQIVKTGGTVTLGAHGQLQGLGAHWELWALAGEGGLPGTGMTPFQALRAATLDAAAKIGLAHDLGSVDVGKLADLVVLDEDPLEDIHHSTSIRYVVKNGALFEGDTLRQLHPVDRPLPPLSSGYGVPQPSAGRRSW